MGYSVFEEQAGPRRQPRAQPAGGSGSDSDRRVLPNCEGLEVRAASCWSRLFLCLSTLFDSSLVPVLRRVRVSAACSQMLLVHVLYAC